MKEPPYSAQHPLVEAAYWLIDKFLGLWELWVFLLVLWALTDGVVYLDRETNIFRNTYRWLRKIPCRINLHDWGHCSDGDFCYWCSKKRPEK